MERGERRGNPYTLTDSLPNGLHGTGVCVCVSVSTRGSTCHIMLQVPLPLLLHLPHHLPLGPTHFVPGHVRVNDWGVAASSGALIASSVCNVIREQRVKRKKRERREKKEESIRCNKKATEK